MNGPVGLRSIGQLLSSHAVQAQRRPPPSHSGSRYRVTNWPAYEAGLRRRGDLTLWLDEAALDGWAAPKRSSPGGQPLYSELAIELVLTLRLVFHLALRQAEAFSRSVLRLLELALPVPDHSTLSRCGRAFAGRQPRVPASSGPVHLVLDSTGLELFGQGERDAEKHGRARRQWRTVSWLTTMPRAASSSSTMRKLSGKRKQSQTEWLMISAGKQ